MRNYMTSAFHSLAIGNEFSITVNDKSMRQPLLSTVTLWAGKPVTCRIMKESAS